MSKRELQFRVVGHLCGMAVAPWLCVAAMLAGCSDDGSPSPPASGPEDAQVVDASSSADSGARDGGTRDGGTRDGGMGDGRTGDGGVANAKPLPACDLACDRVVDCAVIECDALGYGQAGAANRACLDGCDGDWATGVLHEDSCGELISTLKTELRFSNICKLGIECSAAPGCTAYADKVTGCIVASCEPDADGFEVGLKELLFAACMDPEDCTEVSTVDYLTAETTTCESEGLGDLATHETFVGICQPKVGAEEAALRMACESVANCVFYSEFGSMDRCVATLAISGNAAGLASCLTAGADCMEQSLCFQ